MGIRQVITIAANGVMSGLQRKPGEGLDLRQFGKADIKRASLIEWDEAKQSWFIDILQEAGKGKLTYAAFIEQFPGAGTLKLDELCPSGWDVEFPTDKNPLTFTEYHEAVRVEIAYLDALRLAGHY